MKNINEETINYQVFLNDLNVSLDEYVLLIKNKNIKAITFMINAPISEIEYPSENSITNEAFNKLLVRINNLKSNFPDINIYFGVVSDYSKEKEKYLGELRSKVDFVSLKINSTNLDEYFKVFSEAIDSGIFDNFVGIEDLFIYRNSLTNEERKVFDSKMESILTELVNKLNYMNLPVSVNINEFPHSMVDFFRIMSFYHVRTLGIINIKSINDDLTVKNSLTLANMNNLVKNYNPKVERLQNQKLSYIFNSRQSKANTIYTEKAVELLRKVLINIPKETDKEMVLYYIITSLDGTIKVDNDKANYLDKGELNKIESISLSNISSQDKTFELSKTKDKIKLINDTLSRRIMLINLVKECVKTSFQMGASTPEDIITITRYLIEIKTTNNESNKRLLNDELMNLEERLRSSSGKEDNAILSKRNPAFQNTESKQSFNWNSGIINLMSISLILTFILGFGIGIAYMLLKIS